MNGSSGVDSQNEDGEQVDQCPTSCDPELEAKIKEAIEENVGLKSYIDRMNKECMELNAALFEEANKMVREANMKEFNATKLFKEKLYENEILRSELSALKHLISDLSTLNDQGYVSQTGTLPLASASRARTLGSQETKKNQFRHRSTSVSPLKSNRESLDLRPQMSNNDMDTPKQLTRKALLDAILRNSDAANNLDLELFQEFLDWIETGCSLNLPSSVISDLKFLPQRQTDCSTAPKIPNRIIKIIRAYDSGIHEQTSYDSDTDDVKPKGDTSSSTPASNGTEHFKSSPTTKDSDSENLRSSDEFSGTDDSCFIRHLYEDDVKSCWTFQNTEVLKYIYQALPKLGFEIVPIMKKDKTEEESDSINERCPLVPQHEPQFQMKVKIDDDDARIYKISKPARDRIVAVVELFQYLSLIKRGLASSPQPSRAVSPDVQNPFKPFIKDVQIRRDNLLSNPPNSSKSQEAAMRGQQFRTIQRHRLTIAFAKLGFGVPDLD